MAKPLVFPTTVDFTLFTTGMQSETVQLEDIPSAAQLTTRILLDHTAALDVRVVHVTVYRVVEFKVPNNVIPGELPPGVEPGFHTEHVLVIVAQSDGTTPVSVDVGHIVKIGLVVQVLSLSFDRASGALLITGDTWNPISVPLTFMHGSEVTTDFDPVELTAQQGGMAITTLTVRWVSGPAVDVNYYSTVVICPAGVSMLPLGQAEYADTDKGVRDGIADCCTSAGGHRPYGDLPRPV
jgi:hypothetical protein